MVRFGNSFVSRRKQLTFGTTLVLISLFGSSYAQDSSISLTDDSYERSSDQIVLEYEQLISLLGPEGRTKLLIFGDGSLELNKLNAIGSSSNFRSSVDPSVVETLLEEVLSANVLAENSPEEVAPSVPDLQAISDNTYTTFVVRVNSYQDSLGNDVQLIEPIIITEENIAARFLTQEQFNRVPTPTLIRLRDIENKILNIVRGLQ